MKVFDFKGVVVDDAHKEMYDWYEVENVSPNELITFLNESNGEDVEINIDSIGGSVSAGSTMFTAIKEYAGKTTAKITARAYSIASIVPLAADKVVMSPSALYMIHNVSVGSGGGDYREFEKRASMLRNATEGLAQMYVDKTGLSMSEIKSMMNAETFLNAEQAKEKGFIDEIMFKSINTLRSGMVASGMNMLSEEQIKQFENRHNLANKQKQQLALLKLKK